MIEIEKNIPLPINGTTIGVALNKLDVHDSFLLKDPTVMIRQAIHMQSKKIENKTFMTRTEPGGVRVWRLT